MLAHNTGPSPFKSAADKQDGELDLDPEEL